MNFNKNMTKRPSFLLLMIILFLSAFPLISHAVEIRVAVFDGARPVSYVDESGRVTGLFPELLRSVFEGEEYDLKFVTGLSFHEAYNQVLSGEIDIIPAFIMTNERQTQFSFNHEVVLVSWSQIFLHPESSIESVLDLKYKKIALMEGGQNGKNFIELMKSFDIPFMPVFYSDFSSMTRDVLTEKVDAMVSFDSFSRSETRLKSSNILFSPNQSYFAVRKGGPEYLLELIDKSLSAMKKDETSLYHKELKKLRFTDTVEVLPVWFSILTFGLILCILVVSLFIFLLRRRVRIIRERLHDSEDNYSRLFHAARDYIFLVSFSGPDFGRILDVNDSYCKRSGFSREEVLNSGIRDLLFNGDLSLISQIRKKLITTGFSVIESRLSTKTGGSIPVEISSQVFKRDGRTYIISLSRDLSYRDDFKSAMSAMEQKYSTIADYNYDWEVWINDDNTFAYISPSCERISGYTADEFLGNPNLLRSLIHPDDREKWDDHNLQEYGSSMQIKDLRFRIFRKDGEMRWIQHDCRKITSSGGVSLGIRGNYRDITEKIALEEQLSQKQRLESLGILAGGIAHDFNNILAIIKGFSEIAQTRFKDNEEIRNIFESINTASERAVNLTSQILDFSRNRKILKKPVQIKASITEVLKLIKPSFPSNIEIQTSLDSEAYTMADEGQMHRVLVNICTNARLAMPEGGCLHLSLNKVRADTILPSVSMEGPECLELCIRDTGVGMSKEVRTRVFDPFYTTRKAGDGTGMGLSVVHGLISDWGGQIRVESTPGQGSAFFIYLPVTGAIPEAEKESENRRRTIKKGHVLVMDDEEILLKLLGIFLEGEGYTGEYYKNPLEGLDAYSRNPDAFSLAVLDMTMPGMKGDKAALQLKQLRPDLPVIICSGVNEHFDGEHFPEGVDAFLQKPFGRSEFLNAVSSVLAGQSKSSEEH